MKRIYIGKTAFTIRVWQIIQRHWITSQKLLVSRSHIKSAKTSLISNPLTHHFFCCFFFFFLLQVLLCLDDKGSKNKLVNCCYMSNYGSPKALEIGDVCTWGESVSLGNDTNCHIRAFRLLSLLELILKKCKSSTNAVNNNYQVTTKVCA